MAPESTSNKEYCTIIGIGSESVFAWLKGGRGVPSFPNQLCNCSTKKKVRDRLRHSCWHCRVPLQLPLSGSDSLTMQMNRGWKGLKGVAKINLEMIREACSGITFYRPSFQTQLLPYQHSNKQHSDFETRIFSSIATYFVWCATKAYKLSLAQTWHTHVCHVSGPLCLACDRISSRCHYQLSCYLLHSFIFFFDCVVCATLLL